MDQDGASEPPRPRLNVYTKALRRDRIFHRLRLGASCADIAREEGLSGQRVRKIVADTLKRQRVDELPDHALLQLFRLDEALALAAQAVAGGNLKALGPYLLVLERLDRYRKAAKRQVVYDDAARKRLFAKLNRVAAQIQAKERKAASRAADAASPPRADAAIGPVPT